jgi:hypothetical protein
MPVANVELPADKSTVAQARFRVAQLYHYGPVRRWADALEAYNETLQLAGTGSEEFRESLLQRTAVILELSRSALGTQQEVRFTAEQAIRQLPETDIKRKATLRLMHAEAWIDEKLPTKALPEFTELAQIADPTCRREQRAAQLMAGICCTQLKQLDNAESYLKQIVTTPVQDRDQFVWRGKVMKDRYEAAMWLGQVMFYRGKINDAAVWAEFAHDFDKNAHARLPFGLKETTK